MRNTDFAFANNVRAAAELRTPRTAQILLFAAVALLASAITWAHYAVLDEVKRGAGRVIPSRQMQVVQSLEGGIVKNIMVQEGDTVQEGQPVVQMDGTKFNADLGELRAKRNALQTSLSYLNREIELTQRLYQQKVVPEIEMLRIQQKAADLGGQLAVIQETIKTAEDRVTRTELKAPVYGIVNKINVTTIGAVVQPGAPIMDIVPLDDTLLVEAKIRPQDIAYIRPDQEADVKLSAN
jgi:adhesin transport system membrane fusion protein